MMSKGKLLLMVMKEGRAGRRTCCRWRRETPPALCRAGRAARVVGLDMEEGHLERRDERESYVSLETQLGEENCNLLKVERHTKPRVSNEELPCSWQRVIKKHLASSESAGDGTLQMMKAP